MGHQNLAFVMKVCNYVDKKRMGDEIDKLDAVRNVREGIENDNNGKVFKVFNFLHKLIYRKNNLHRTTEKIQNSPTTLQNCKVVVM